VITRRGWALVGSAAGLFVAGRILGLVQLAVLALAALITLVVAIVWVRANAPRLLARREVKERLQVGVQGRVDVVVEATGNSPTLSINDAFDGGRRAARLLLAPLHAGEEARAAYRFPTDRRGRFEVGPLRATVSDPFGLVQGSRYVLGAEQVIVYPRVRDLLPPPETGGLDLDREQPQVRSRIEPSGEFHTLRDYAPGDDLRHVHWRSTARRGQLMMRQNEARRRTPVLVLLDVRPGAHDRASFERAVEACASIVTAIDRADRPVEVLLSTGVTIGTQGRRHLGSVMDELAVIEPNGPERMVAAETRRRTGALVAIVGRVQAVDAAALAVLVRDGGQLTVVACVPEATDVLLRTRRLRRPFVVANGPDRPLTDSWNEAVVRWQPSAHRSQSTSRARA
jgi:uncharacterized protein (DUF58 family)